MYKQGQTFHKTETKRRNDKHAQKRHSDEQRAREEGRDQSIKN